MNTSHNYLYCRRIQHHTLKGVPNKTCRAVFAVSKAANESGRSHQLTTDVNTPMQRQVGADLSRASLLLSTTSSTHSRRSDSSACDSTSGWHRSNSTRARRGSSKHSNSTRAREIRIEYVIMPPRSASRRARWYNSRRTCGSSEKSASVSRRTGWLPYRSFNSDKIERNSSRHEARRTSSSARVAFSEARAASWTRSQSSAAKGKPSTRTPPNRFQQQCPVHRGCEMAGECR